MTSIVQFNMSAINTLWIDAETPFVQSMKSLLNDGYVIHHYSDFDAELLNSIKLDQIDIVLLELQLNGKRGLDFVADLRTKKTNIPIVVITAHADKMSCIQALNLGINGFMEKPVRLDDLKEMITKHHCRDGYNLTICPDRKAIYSQNQWVDLTSTEYKILETLVNAGRRLTRAELQSSVWPNSTISENNLDTHLTNLKRKIPELAANLNVKRGLGYYLEKTK
jgi:DNA-binding response OmpR family regulator